jgi:hypothetical protein
VLARRRPLGAGCAAERARELVVRRAGLGAGGGRTEGRAGALGAGLGAAGSSAAHRPREWPRRLCRLQGMNGMKDAGHEVDHHRATFKGFRSRLLLCARILMSPTSAIRCRPALGELLVPRGPRTLFAQTGTSRQRTALAAAAAVAGWRRRYSARVAGLCAASQAALRAAARRARPVAAAVSLGARCRAQGGAG